MQRIYSDLVQMKTSYSRPWESEDNADMLFPLPACIIMLSYNWRYRNGGKTT